ncbi:hypothetical protein [Paenibacillus sp. NRS-1780]|uniref:hypothetical protein n=1 Tax=Paenibacillus sp. NRS-1780 TaxID=3233904 RepID=UPI003D29ABBF
MESFIASVIFVLPGFLMYFFIQSFGINSVVKHNPTEMASFSALLWFPVAYISLGVLNLFLSKSVWNLTDIKEAAGSIGFLISFFLISAVASLMCSIIYAKYLYTGQTWIINKVRKWRGVADLSDSPSVWDEVFGGNVVQVVAISKIDKPEAVLIGEIDKAPRAFETEKALHLKHVKLFTRLVHEYNISVESVFFDTKSGTCIKIYNLDEATAAYKKDSDSGER